jgi:hypothetical protein
LHLPEKPESGPTLLVAYYTPHVLRPTKQSTPAPLSRPPQTQFPRFPPKAHNISPFNFNQLQNQLERIVSQESALGFPSLSREPRFSCCQYPRTLQFHLTNTNQTR